jgi:hypothetical protein
MSESSSRVYNSNSLWGVTLAAAPDHVPAAPTTCPPPLPDGPRSLPLGGFLILYAPVQAALDVISRIPERQNTLHGL